VVVLAIIRDVASLALITAAWWLPWATLDEGPLGVTTFTAGSLADRLVALALVSVAMSTAALRWSTTWIRWAVLGSSICAFGLAVLLALHSISLANSVPTHAYSHTSYASGAVLGVLSGGAMTATAVLGLRTS
jgi:hypothetical protein